jgi:predicted ABC-class ATPase
VDQAGAINARFTLSMPARGRSIQGHAAAQILSQTLPSVVSRALVAACYDQSRMASFQKHVDCVEDQETLRRLVVAGGYVGFVRDGSLLPRASGSSDAPMLPAHQVTLFQSPASLRRTFDLPHVGAVVGMAIPTGVTLICGGGFHGKTTLLQALETGVYNRVPGDGREYCCMNVTSVKIRAEDGRAVESVDITPFINNLPGGKRTDAFTTKDASGSTSQAASIAEALEVGSTCLLIEEDTAATNFMVRDTRMQRLDKSDPITPYLHKVKSLSSAGVSSVMVVGGCGDYFEVADLVLMMDEYLPVDVTEQVREICRGSGGSGGGVVSEQSFGTVASRALNSRCLSTEGKIVARRLDCLQFDQIDVDLRGVEQLVEVSQVRTIANILTYVDRRGLCDGKLSLSLMLDEIERVVGESGLDGVATFAHPGDLVHVRRQDIAAALNRLRVLSTTRVGRIEL